MRAHFDIFDTSIQGLKLLQRKPIRDDRGYLERMFCSKEMKSLIPGKNIVQINHTLTAKRGTVRGMHFQRPPHAEIKFISCLRGEVFDVAVDIRRDSPTFLRWHAEILNVENHKTLVIPEGFAHGFAALEESYVFYKTTKEYAREYERGILWNDPDIGIKWPIDNPNVSDRDKNSSRLKEAKTGFVYHE